jgi:hypothetical protein
VSRSRATKLAPRIGEDVCGEFAGRAGQNGLGAKAGQLAGAPRGEVLRTLLPEDGAVEAFPILVAVSQPMMGHAQEERPNPSTW